MSWRREQTATYWPKVPLTIAALLSHFAGLLNWGSLRVASPQSASWFSHWHLVSNRNCNSNSNSLKLSVALGYIIVWHPPASCGPTHLPRIQLCPQVKVIPRYLRPDAPVIYTGTSLNWQLGRGPICYIGTCLSFRLLWFSLCGHLGRQSPLYSRFSFFLLISQGLFFRP